MAVFGGIIFASGDPKKRKLNVLIQKSKNTTRDVETGKAPRFAQVCNSQGRRDVDPISFIFFLSRLSHSLSPLPLPLILSFGV